MSDLTLTKTRLRAGVWEGHLAQTGDFKGDTPRIEAFHLETPIEHVDVKPVPDAPGHWMVKVPIPPQILSDGVQTVTIAETGTGETLSSFSLIAGEPLDEDLRAEVSLLRAELDMLKRAFRRHCHETN